jgi:CheY-like chemotaxis protein
MQRPRDLHGRPNRQTRTKRLKILLIDSNEADVYLFQEAFRVLRAVHELQIARDGEQALAGLRTAESGNQLPALILLDIDLPKVDGFEVLRAIRAGPRQRAIPVIVFTASPDQRQVRRAYELGANAYVCKPLDHLVDVVGDLERFWLRRAQLPELE